MKKAPRRFIDHLLQAKGFSSDAEQVKVRPCALISDVDVSTFILRVLYSYRDDLPENAVKRVRRQAKFSVYIYTDLCSRGLCFWCCQ